MKGKKNKEEKKNKKKALKGKEKTSNKKKITPKAKTASKKAKKPVGKKEKREIILKRETTKAKKRVPAEPVRREDKSTWKNEIRDMLLQMRKELLKDVSLSAKMERDYLRFDVGDFYDHASSDRDRELMLTLTDRERDKLVLIDEALKKIKEGSYGECESCGDDIGEDRLRAMPLTKLCLSCKIDLERQGSTAI